MTYQNSQKKQYICNWTRTQNHLVLKRTLNHRTLNSHFTFRFCACFEEGVPWHSGNCRVWIHSRTRTWHDKNIQLRAYGFSKQAFSFMCSYLKNKRQRVQISNKFSSLKEVIARVPQGSIDGPLLFNLFIMIYFFSFVLVL